MLEIHEKKLKIAIMGHRGIPANYGGFETFAEEIAHRLKAEGHEVLVYCRSHYAKRRMRTYKRVKLVYLPAMRNKCFETITHTFFCVMHASCITRPDVILMVNVGNALVSWIPRFFGIPVLLNVDGLEWERRKWSRIAKFYLKFSSWCATFMATSIVTDARVIQDYYASRYGITASMIPYGAYVERNMYPTTLARYGLTSGRYFLYVGRFEPENNTREVVESFMQSKSPYPLVVIGDATYNNEYKRTVLRAADHRVKFLGFVYGKDYKGLMQNAFAYIHATEVGGTHPALIEGMGYGNRVLVNATPENKEVAGDAVQYFSFLKKKKKSPCSLIELINSVVTSTPIAHQRWRVRAQLHIKKTYQWDDVSREYDILLHALLEKKRTFVKTVFVSDESMP